MQLIFTEQGVFVKTNVTSDEKLCSYKAKNEMQFVTFNYFTFKQNYPSQSSRFKCL